MTRRIRLAGAAAAVAALLAACGPAGETAEQHEIELPNGAESAFPMPQDAAVHAVQEPEEGVVSLVFNPRLPFAEATAFYSEAFAADGWTLLEQDVPSAEGGERNAQWRAQGHGVVAEVTMTAFGGADSTRVNASAVVEAAD